MKIGFDTDVDVVSVADEKSNQNFIVYSNLLHPFHSDETSSEFDEYLFNYARKMRNNDIEVDNSLVLSLAYQGYARVNHS